MRVAVARRLLELGLAGVRLAEPQVLLDRAVEQVGVLVHDRDLRAHLFGVERPDVPAADPHGPGLRVEQPQQETRDRGFAGTARADDADLLAGGDREGQPVMRRLPPAGIGEMDVLERDGRR